MKSLLTSRRGSPMSQTYVCTYSDKQKSVYQYSNWTTTTTGPDAAMLYRMLSEKSLTGMQHNELNHRENLIFE